MSVSVDLWSDRRKRSFMATSASFLTEEFEYEAVLLDVSYLKSPHTGARIFDEFEKANFFNMLLVYYTVFNLACIV